MERYPRGSIPPYAFRAVATVAPAAVAREAIEADAEPAMPDAAAIAQCELATTCPTCTVEMLPEHAHYKCPVCGYRDSCCF